MITVLCPRQPRHVHRAGMRQGQTRSTQAGSGQEESQGKGAAPPEDLEHALS